ncbi:MAG: four helix bundle protein [bacterium]
MTLRKIYDLEERTMAFSKAIIDLCKSIYRTNKNIINTPIIEQLVRSSTSIGANYCEANGASSKKDFKNKIFICKKESKETLYWIRLLEESIVDKNSKTQCGLLWKEAHELVLIFSKIASTTQ